MRQVSPEVRSFAMSPGPRSEIAFCSWSSMISSYTGPVTAASTPIGTGKSGAKRSARSFAAFTLVSSWTQSALAATSFALTTFGRTPSMMTARRSSCGPKSRGLPGSSRSSYWSFCSLSYITFHARSLYTLQFWRISTNAAPLWWAARLNISSMCAMLRSTEREREGVHRAIGGAERRGFRDLAELARGRVLTLREAVDPVVEQQDRHVHVSAEHVEHVVAADRQPVAVPRHDEHLEIRACQPEPGGDGRGAAVDGVEPVGVHVVRKPARAADPRDEDDVLLRDAEVRHRLLHRGEDRVVPAARAPPDVLVGLEVLLRVLGCFLRLGAARAHVGLPTSWLMASRISSLASGRPRMRLKPTASTRYSARSPRTSWPLLISGTSPLRSSRRIWPRSGGSGFM